LKGAVQNAVIVISGMPGSGKSTLGRSLSAALDVPYLDKDEILERLFEIRGIGDIAWRRELSRASDNELISSVQASNSVVVSSFWRAPGTSAASGTAIEWLAELNRPIVEIFCYCDAETAASRFKSRKRHPGHLDASRSFPQLLEQLQRLAEAGPLRVGELIVVDTRTEPDVEDVARRIRAKVLAE
jgi:shikimate kinase